MNKEMTAVEWLVRKLSTELIGEIPLHRWDEIREAVQQAKQMHEKQMFESFKAGQDSMEEGGKSFDIYIQETYGKSDSSTLVS